MNLVLVGKKKILFEKNRNANDLTVMYVPDEDGIQIFHDLQGSKTDYEVASRAGAPGKKPVWRDIGGKIALYGWVPDELTSRTASARIWLPQDFLSEDSTIFYFVVSPTHLVHGRKEVDDEQKSSWRITTIKTGSEEELIGLVKSSLVDQLMTGDNQVPSVAVYQDPPLQLKIDDALKYLNVASQPLEKMSPAFRQVRPLYRQRNNTLLLLVLMLFFFLVLLGSTFYWILGMVESRKIQQQIEEVRFAIQNIQINERIGYIKAPEAIQQRIRSTFNQLPSSFVDAALRTGAQFGDLEKMKFDVPLNAGEGTFTASAGAAPGVYTFNLLLSRAFNPMLVDQETMARQVVPNTPWLREISNVGNSGPSNEGLTLLLKLQVEETPEMQALKDAQTAGQPAPVMPLPAQPTAAVSPSQDVSPIAPTIPVADVSDTQVSPTAPADVTPTLPADAMPAVSPTAAGGSQ
jgi:hypothetical protein